MKSIKDFMAERDAEIFAKFCCGKRQKVIATEHGLSPSRVKVIIAEQKKRLEVVKK